MNVLFYLAGIISGFLLVIFFKYVKHVWDTCDEDVAEEETEYEAYVRKYEEDLMRQLNNILRYDGTDANQEGEDEE